MIHGKGRKQGPVHDTEPESCPMMQWEGEALSQNAIGEVRCGYCLVHPSWLILPRGGVSSSGGAGAVEAVLHTSFHFTLGTFTTS